MTSVLEGFKIVWRGWLKFAHVLGTIQMVIVLSIIYWTIFALMAIPFRLFANSLGNKVPGGAGWRKREPVADLWTQLHNQG